MSHFRTTLIAVGSLAACAMMTGCEPLRHNLHFERLWRLNRGPAVGTLDASFSVSDPQATADTAVWREIVRQESVATPEGATD
jgi:hypothetical protein